MGRQFLAGIEVLPAFLSLASVEISLGSSAGVHMGLLVGFSVDWYLAHWLVFPASVVCFVVALAAGVSGALLFSPFFPIVVGLASAQAIVAGLLTEVFGMGTDLRTYVIHGVVDYRTAGWFLLDALLAHLLDPASLKALFGSGLLLLAGFLIGYDSPEAQEPRSARPDAAGKARETVLRQATVPCTGTTSGDGFLACSSPMLAGSSRSLSPRNSQRLRRS